MCTSIESFDQRRARVLALLVPDACHKLNNSIAVISGMTELTLYGSDRSRSKANLDTVFDHSREVAKQLSRISALALTAKPDTVSDDAGFAFRDAAHLLVPVFQVSHTRFSFDEVELTYPAVFDKRRLIQVLVILACSPLLDSNPRNFDFDAQSKLEQLSMTIDYEQSIVGIELRYPVRASGEAEATASLVLSTLTEFGASLTTSCDREGTIQRVELRELV